MLAINQLAYAWWSWMSSMFWQVSLLVVIVSVLDMLVRRWLWPQVRYALWLLIFIKLVIPPGWALQTGIVTGVMPGTREYLASRWESTFPGPGQEQALPGAGGQASFQQAEPGREAASVPDQGGGTGSATEDEGARQPMPQGAAGEPSAQGLSVQSILLFIWLAGIAFYSILLAAKIRKLRRWHREQVEKKTIPAWFHEILVETGGRLKLHELPAIVFSGEAVTPAVYGVFRPVLLLPANYIDALSKEEAGHILMHELAHLKRGDLWVHGATMLLQIVYWFNPLLLWASRQIKHVREICCDLTIAGYLRENTDGYRKTLLETARELLTQSIEPGMGLLGVFEEPFWLVARIRWLEKRTWEKRRPIAAGVIILLFIMVPFVLPMAASGPENFAGEAAKVTDEPGLSTPGAGQGGGEDVKDQSAQGPGADTPDAPGDGAYASPEKTSGPEKAWQVKDVTRQYKYVLWYLQSSSLSSMGEIWFGDGRISLEDNNRRYILDRKKNVFIVINMDNGSYFESPLPVDKEEALSEDFKWRQAELQYDGEVKKTGRRRECLGKECTKFDVTTWEVRNDVEGYTSNIQVWTSTDMPFDLTLFHDLMDIRRELSGRTPALREKMREVKGIQMLIEQEQEKFPFKARYVTKVVEITERTAPEGVFEVPQGYDRKNKIEPPDLR